MIIHIFDPTRPHQTRGLAQIVTALKDIRMFSKFSDIQLQNAVARSSIMAYIKSEKPKEENFAQLGVGMHPDAGHGLMGAYDAAVRRHLEQAISYARGSQSAVINGVRVPHFFPGTELHMLDPSADGAFGSEFAASLMRGVAAALGLSYEELSKDFSRTNYSSLRAGMLPTWRAMLHTKRTVADRVANATYRLWLEESIGRGLIDSMPRHAKSIEWLYQGLNFDSLAAAQWIGAAKGNIDELKEDQASVLRLNNGLTTLEQECAARGLDWRDVLRQIGREEAEKKRYGLGDFFGTSTAKSEAAIAKGPKDYSGDGDDDE